MHHVDELPRPQSVQVKIPSNHSFSWLNIGCCAILAAIGWRAGWDFYDWLGTLF